MQLVYPRNDFTLIRYFTALVRPLPNDLEQPQRQQSYLRALRTIPGLEIHLGQFTSHEVRLPMVSTLGSNRPKFARVRKTEEKGSDVNLASYLLLDAFKKDVNLAVVVSDDFDLKEPLAIAQRELGIDVGVVSPRCKTWLRSAVGAK